jgi:DNA polymerase III subunit epsilon
VRSLPLRRQYHRLRKRFSITTKLSAKLLASDLLDCWSKTTFSPTEQVRDMEFLVVDTETSALTTREGELLSIGWVVIKNNAVQMSSTQHLLLQVENSVGQSAVIHQLRDCELEEGMAPQTMMQQFLQQAAGRILVFHHAELDLAFLNLLSQQLYGLPLLLPHVDTLQIEKVKLLRKHQTIEQGALRLSACRERYNLPAYPAHNALMDALATSELLLAQCAVMGESVRVGDIS